MKKYKVLINGTFLSILIFFSTSFITVLIQIAPIKYYKRNESYNLDIGFPFKYYEEFWLKGNVTPNFGWNGLNLIYNIITTWFIVFGEYYLLNRNKT
jgi:hypothetical protein